MLVEEPSRIASRFLDARRAATGLAGFPGPMPATLEEAYAIQDEAIACWGEPIIGWKVGRVAADLSERFGTDRLAGPIFIAVTAVGQDVTMPVFAEGFAAGEAEFLLRIGRTPPPEQKSFSLTEASELIDAVHVGIEVASSPLRTINALGPVAVISDFGNNNGVVVGPRIANWRESGFEHWTVTTRIDGDEVGSGCAASFPDGAIGAARFLFELMAQREIALLPGQWISSGAVTGVHDVQPGRRFEADFQAGLSVSCRLTPAMPQ